MASGVVRDFPNCDSLHLLTTSHGRANFPANGAILGTLTTAVCLPLRVKAVDLGGQTALTALTINVARRQKRRRIGRCVLPGMRVNGRGR